MKFAPSKPVAIAVLLLLTIALPAFATQVSLPDGPRSASSCPQDWSASETIAPSKIVVQPWKGRHHIYAEFKLPPGKWVSDRAKVSLDRVGEFCGGVTEIETLGKTKAIAYIRTRTALWLLVQGRINDLKQAKNWQLPIAG